jgi:hypothetical protein
MYRWIIQTVAQRSGLPPIAYKSTAEGIVRVGKLRQAAGSRKITGIGSPSA